MSRRSRVIDSHVAPATEPRLDLSSPCIPWSGRVALDGYGRTGTHNLFNQRTYGTTLAHRAVYEQVYGPIPAGRQIGHACHDNDPSCPGGSRLRAGECLHRACVNPLHLVAQTQAENRRAQAQQRRSHLHMVSG